MMQISRAIRASTVLSVLLLATLGCTSAPLEPGAAGPRVTTNQYEDLIMSQTQHAVQYDGFYNKFEMYATFMNSNVQTTVLQKKSDTFGWDTPTAQRERERLFQENTTQTKFFLSFYSPTPRLNDLHKGSSIWRAYLEVGGKRYDGKITKAKGKLEELNALYPFHTRWNVPFEVVFNIPLSGVEGDAHPVFVLTSSQGAATLKF